MSPDPAAESVLVASRIRHLIRELQDAVKAHRVTAQKLRRRDQALQNRASTAGQQARQALEQSFEEEKEELRAQHRQGTARLAAHYDQWQQRRHQAFEQLKRQISADGAAAEEQATQTFQQRVWASGSSVEALRDRAADERRHSLDRLQVIEADLQRGHQRCHKLARLVRIPWPELPESAANGLEDDDEIERAIEALDQDRDTCHSRIDQAMREAGPGSALFRLVPILVLVLALLHIGTALLLPRLVDLAPLVETALLVSPILWLLAPFIGLLIARRRFRPHMSQVRELLEAASTVAAATRVQIEERYQRQLDAAQAAHETAEQEAQADRQARIEEGRRETADRIAHVKARYERLEGVIERRRRQAIANHEARCENARAALAERQPAQLAELEQEQADQREILGQEQKDAWQQLYQDWEDQMHGLFQQVRATRDAYEQRFPPWADFDFPDWTPPADFPPAIPFGELQVDLQGDRDYVADETLNLPGPPVFSLPALMSFPSACNLLLEAPAAGREQALATLQDVMMRLLTSLPPGKVSFTIIDPIGLGESFAGFMHLADYDERFVGRRIWVETRHIEQQLADLNEHMEKVIQKYLRNEFETIAEFNESAGEMAERYRFVVICDFPANFSEMAAQRLASILTSGPRCGVFVLMHKDRREPPPAGLDLALLRRESTWLNYESDGFAWQGELAPEVPLELEAPPAGDILTQGLQRLGASLAEASRVEVPFADIAPPSDELWSRSSGDFLRAPVGKAGARQVQELSLGKGTSQHVLVAGKTGSGKSTLFHVLITSLSLWYSPDDLEFYLIDFKKGVEFKCYAREGLPHIRAVAIESDREFGLSILHRVDRELKERGERFRDRSVQDLTAYRQLDDHQPTPRTILLIDEFQELFVADDRISQEAALLLDRIVRQGRAFGIHVILGSQTLGGAYSLPRATMGQMAVRIALQCSEADSYMILDDDNAAARLLSRPGEAIYNDAAGSVEGNSPFQVTWLPDHERDERLAQISERARQTGRDDPATIVFEGNAPARLTDNDALRQALAAPSPEPAASLTLWLGQPNVIKSPTQVSLRRLTGSNLLLVGQSPEPARSLFATMLLSLFAQATPGADRIYLLDGSLPDSPHADYFPHLCQHLGDAFSLHTYRELPELIPQLDAELTTRANQDELPGAIVLLVYGLQRFKLLRQSEEFGFSFEDGEQGGAVDKQFARLLSDGPEARLHTIAWCDSLNNLNRTLNRQLIGEFDERILFQMSANDSVTLIDTPEASKLGLHWAVHYSDQRGSLEKFRPYALPTLDQPLFQALQPQP